MDKETLKDKIAEVIDNAKLGSVATIKDGKPWVRYMVIQHDENLDCYSSSFASSRKVEQINKDENIHITIGGDANDFSKPYLNIQATAQVLSDLETKKKIWTDHLKKYFSGPEDPNYVVIKYLPQFIEYMIPGSMQPEIYEVNS